ncbi:transcriptional regulator/sugar kinase [Corynebacterium mustelae]|uniref:Transcriptional regulator/sugar kinase n=1 Tax=Corynebacterium mustelae TaxID=571915 RepID=A0A0G3GZA4_9CORY|nr:ROK family protein [Corynebacterium mustelae]AKK06509.1 transcriptional regulator/sugar kinase [Corynebacterium mustelae]
MSSTVTVGFDIGGTNMRAGVVTAEGEIIASVSSLVPQTDADLMQGIVGTVEKLSEEYSIGAVGLAVAGFLDPACEVVRFAPHLPWRDRAVRAELTEALGLPVWLEHDANSAAWGEYRFGAAQGSDNWVLFAIGTGIGATLMHNGEIYRGAFGTAPEFGHLQVVPNGRPCPCGKHGCLERYCSGTALAETARELMMQEPHLDSLLRHEISISGKSVMESARRGDPVAVRAVADFSRWLGLGLSIVSDVLDPGLIVIGGGVSQDPDLYMDAAVAEMSRSIVGAGFRPLPHVTCAQLGGDAGMIGVADLARKLL